MRKTLIILVPLPLFFMGITNKRLDALKDGNALREFVIVYIKENYRLEERKAFFDDLLGNGCASGMIGELIYYADTHAFYDRFYAEIEELRQEWEDSTGEPIKIKGDLKNDLAWFGFEETVCQIARELDLW